MPYKLLVSSFIWECNQKMTKYNPGANSGTIKKLKSIKSLLILILIYTVKIYTNLSK